MAPVDARHAQDTFDRASRLGPRATGGLTLSRRAPGSSANRMPVAETAAIDGRGPGLHRMIDSIGVGCADSDESQTSMIAPSLHADGRQIYAEIAELPLHSTQRAPTRPIRCRIVSIVPPRNPSAAPSKSTPSRTSSANCSWGEERRWRATRRRACRLGDAEKSILGFSGAGRAIAEPTKRGTSSSTAAQARLERRPFVMGITPKPRLVEVSG